MMDAAGSAQQNIRSGLLVPSARLQRLKDSRLVEPPAHQLAHRST
eukprot:COSAG06_NODE_48794_length_329_cov_1.200000_1_plen_44_part_10